MSTCSRSRAAVSAFSTSCRVSASAKMKPRYRSPSGSGRTRWPSGDGDGQAGDPGHGRGTVLALDRAEHARARDGEHEHARTAGPGHRRWPRRAGRGRWPAPVPPGSCRRGTAARVSTGRRWSAPPVRAWQAPAGRRGHRRAARRGPGRQCSPSARAACPAVRDGRGEDGPGQPGGGDEHGFLEGGAVGRAGLVEDGGDGQVAAGRAGRRCSARGRAGIPRSAGARWQAAGLLPGPAGSARPRSRRRQCRRRAGCPGWR